METKEFSKKLREEALKYAIEKDEEVYNTLTEPKEVKNDNTR